MCSGANAMQLACAGVCKRYICMRVHVLCTSTTSFECVYIRDRYRCGDSFDAGCEFQGVRRGWFEVGRSHVCIWVIFKKLLCPYPVITEDFQIKYLNQF